jgi:spore coat polysaccharide biosynthesis protein SpsF
MNCFSVGIIIARMDSQRLPGKALRKVGPKPLIGWVIARARRSTRLSKLVVATTSRKVDDPLVEYATGEGVDVYRGDCEDVARRVLDCAEKYHADYFVRMNGDSPFLDPVLIDQGLDLCINGIQFVTNLIDRTFPYGVAVEIVKTDYYKKLYLRMGSNEDREHVTKAIYADLNRINFRKISSPCPDLARARLVVDTEEDEFIVKCLVARLGAVMERVGFERVAQLRMGLNPV